jgi:alanine racemase
MNSNYRHTFAEINLTALQYNLKKVRDYAASAKIMAVIKADAYGHGILNIADSLSAADAFAVACVDEGLVLREHLRKNNSNKAIVILEGFNSAQELNALIDYDLIAVINNFSQLDILSKSVALSADTYLNTGLKVWLKFDTGMHRLGFHISQLKAVQNYIGNLSDKVRIQGIMSHFACADQPQSAQINNRQLLKFNQICKTIDENNDYDYSIANSAAIINLLDSHCQWVRPGIMLYGINPIENQTGSDIGLQSVMTLKSKLIAINDLNKGDCIGYGADWCCPEDMQVGVVAIGYGDGYPRHAISGTPVLLNGVKTQLIGRVSMDMITIDLRPFTNKMPIKIGDPVTLWGKGLPAEKIADFSGTIAYELLCGVSNRVVYEYVS